MLLFLILLAVDSLASPALIKHARIIGGLSVTTVDIPYIVSITANGVHMCGGSIVNKRTIITAAHCLPYWTARELKVHAGARTHDVSEGQMIDVKAIHSNGLYNGTTMDYDVALLRLTKDLTYSLHVQPIELSQQLEIEDNVATVAGWGYLTAGGLEAEELNCGQVPIVDQKTCSRLMDDEITSRMLCAGYLRGGIDACHKDSGGPLTVHRKLIGIVSWGDGCALPNRPGVYTRISKVLPGIVKFMDHYYNEQIIVQPVKKKLRRTVAQQDLIGDIPYIVSINANGVHKCGGSIINKRTVLTAAHCLAIWKPSNLKVHAGASSHDISEGQLIEVEAIHSHELFKCNTMDYDLGLVRLSKDLNYTAYVQSIKLTRKNETQVKLATMAGWGTANEEKFENLNFVKVPIVDHDHCSRLLGAKVTDRLICAGFVNGGINVCPKDSGGPLTAQKELIGIFSWGDGCKIRNSPGVFTRISTFVPWISAFMAKTYNETI